MFKFYAAITLLLFAATYSQAQLTYTVKLKYKKSNYTLSQPSSFLTQKAIARRTKQHIAIDSADLPINRSYLDSIANVQGVTIKSRSRWFNQVVVEITDPYAIDTINSFSFVQRSSVVGTTFAPETKIKLEKIEPELNIRPHQNSVLDNQGMLGDTFNYGNNYQQIHIHEGEYLHNGGFMGQGITIAMLDGGYLNYRNNIAFDSVIMNGQIKEVYD